ncbi:MAG: S9 family peptidase [Gammaproteobacteria bacterium]|nr:S9 family peptidase [Gammaproteobacteria bacterium]
MQHRYIYLLLILLASTVIQAKKLTIDRIYDSPSLSGDSVRGLKFSPDGTRVTFLKGKASNSGQLDLWEYHIATGKTQMLFDSEDLHSGEEVLSDEEKARRERMRLSGSGIVSYQWSSDGKALLFPLAGDVYYHRLGETGAKKLIETPQFETDIRFSPKGNHISFIREQNLYVMNIASGKETQLTRDGGGVIKNGMAEFVAQEEMGRMTGYWWSPDESKIAFTRVDESPVEEVTRSEIYADEIKMIKQRYPFAGKNNVLIALGVIQLDNKNVSWIDLGKDKDIYLPRVQWTQDSTQLTFQWQSRDQKQLKLNLYDLNSKKSRTLIHEKSNTWINLHNDLRFLGDGKQFIWASEKDGYKHLYLHSLANRSVKQLTRGKWVVDDVVNIDEDKGLIYFTGRKDTPLEKHLYSVNLKSAVIKKISQRSGFHFINFAGDSSRYIDNFSSVDTPPQISIHQADGKHEFWMSENKIDKSHPLNDYMSDWIQPSFATLKANDGSLLYYRLYKPADFDASKKYPVMVYLYGGPHAQRVTNMWGNLFLQYMAQQGYVVFTIDNRGSNYRGKKFEDHLYRAMGGVELEDQITGVKYLHSLSWVDKDNIGVHGHSYGGYMTLMAMFKAGDYFKAGVSGAPVTDWTLYDTHYTERYMGHPVKDKQAYNDSSVFPYATDLKGNLLIYHGMADDNVLFKNSTKLYKLLQDNNLPFYVMDYPGKKHGIRGTQTQKHRANLIKNFFDLHLK